MRTLTLCVFVLVLISSSPVMAYEKPEPLTSESPCKQWSGTDAVVGYYCQVTDDGNPLGGPPSAMWSVSSIVRNFFGLWSRATYFSLGQ